MKRYPKEAWDDLQKFLSSSAGRATISATQSRFEAATVIKKMCLKELTLGEILQILHMTDKSFNRITFHLELCKKLERNDYILGNFEHQLSLKGGGL
ncbi:hypothetical protein K7X08_009262 [Anisodus acutangulus]|uniref:Uncharacterized protein n=1 Tax=Anisodus acutangulus TaxID=402998 RepID=A0A9Q1RTY7_9SOLA|nr:hypothetical protein K7X08_009262 [Anisodus acutangulus]